MMFGGPRKHSHHGIVTILSFGDNGSLGNDNDDPARMWKFDEFPLEITGSSDIFRLSVDFPVPSCHGPKFLRFSSRARS